MVIRPFTTLTLSVDVAAVVRFPEASSLGSDQQSDGRRGRRPPEGVKEKTEEKSYKYMCRADPANQNLLTGVS